MSNSFMWSSIPSLISPYILHTPWISIRWYGFMYVLSIVVVCLVCLWRLRHETFHISKEQFLDALIYAFVGMVIGARLFYILFYDPAYYLAHPAQIIWPWENGIFIGLAGFSYHGGLMGAATGCILYCKRYRMGLWELADLLLPAIPLGYFFGRIGNFLNGELYGRVTDAPWGMYFPSDPTGMLRHPSQLYEAFAEGLLCFVILWIMRKRMHGMRLLGLYVSTYALARICVEFFREPDPQIGYIGGIVTMGQLLSLITLCMGVGLIFFQKKHT